MQTRESLPSLQFQTGAWRKVGSHLWPGIIRFHLSDGADSSGCTWESWSKLACALQLTVVAIQLDPSCQLVVLLKLWNVHECNENAVVQSSLTCIVAASITAMIIEVTIMAAASSVAASIVVTSIATNSIVASGIEDASR